MPNIIFIIRCGQTQVPNAIRPWRLLRRQKKCHTKPKLEHYISTDLKKKLFLVQLIQLFTLFYKIFTILFMNNKVSLHSTISFFKGRLKGLTPRRNVNNDWTKNEDIFLSNGIKNITCSYLLDPDNGRM